ncbi:TerB family tellurite resistance protein (plasmid) [Deinococcus sp. KNUC1210]|uniref:TerB family tellurite resistance protein n=1 Tax=Deinococcus sp. KNUC1210 TaxID=2917691 RepID=UPI001EEFD42D|nr:TerB family tellurite resistance protein [Deinococcus sp. KNUC1210]ULH17680.1 TerB family tellurite resistance protein [Deinococcus sp. KNUC1210]
MFFEALNERHKELLLGVLCEVAQADGVIHDAEKDVLVRYGLSLGLDAEMVLGGVQTSTELPPQELLDLPASVKRMVWMEACTLAMIDGDFAVSEQEMLQRLGERLNLDAASQGALERHVARGMDWTLEAMRLVNVEEHA